MSVEPPCVEQRRSTGDPTLTGPGPLELPARQVAGRQGRAIRVDRAVLSATLRIYRGDPGRTEAYRNIEWPCDG